MGISAQGTKLYIGGTAGGAKTVTAIAVGFPTILTSAAHGFQNGDYVTFNSGFTGANAATLNGKSYVVQNRTANSYAIEEDTTGQTITAGTASATSATWTVISGGTSIKGLDGSAKEIETTTHDSTAVEMILGLQDNGNMNLEYDGNNADPGQIALQAAKADGAIRTFKYVLPAGSTPTATFQGFVKKWDMSAAVNDKYKRTLDLRISGPVTFS